MKQYEQEVTIVLSEGQATSLRVALDGYLRQFGDVSNAHPNSCVGNNAALREDLRKVMVGDKSSKLATYRMIPK